VETSDKKREIQIFGIGGPAWGTPWFNCAPFPAKLETWLRLAGVPYRGVNVTSMRKSPKKKMPWIVDGDLTMGDSELIIRHLAETRGIDLDAGLTDEQRGLARAVHALLEEHYHQIWEWFTFLGPGNRPVAEEIFQQLPAFIRPIARVALRRALKKQLHARGIGRHTDAEIFAMGIADIDAVAALLGDKPFALGDEPHTVDAAVFAFIGLTVWQPPFTPIHERARSHANLVAYCDRMRDRLFGAAGADGDAIAA
jgi:glutathione S-transferase